MAHFNFVIPSKRELLLSHSSDYFVKNVVVPREISSELQIARQSLKDDGVEFILERFDVYYSVVHHGSTIPVDVTFKSYEDLQLAVNQMNNAIGYLLNDKTNINEEIQQKYQNIMKMLIYIYTELILQIENKSLIDTRNESLLKGRKRKANKDDVYTLDKNQILSTLNKLINMEINCFWDPPTVEENFLNLISELCYKFLQNPMIKGQKTIQENLFDNIGTLIKNYGHGKTFSIRMAQMLKCEEHVVQCLSEGLQQLVQQLNCKSLIHALVSEVTEWQTDERFLDSQGSRNCAQFLTSVAILMPDLMIPELLYLNKYLYHESVPLRNSVLNIIVEVILNVLTKQNLTDEESQARNDLFMILIAHMKDVSAIVRSKVFQHWARLQKENAIPAQIANDILQGIIDHLEDKSALVRKYAATCVTTFLSSNVFGAKLSLKQMQIELENKTKILTTITNKIEEINLPRTEESQRKWNEMLPKLKRVIEEELEKDDDETNDNDDDNDNEHVVEDTDEIFEHLQNERFKEAFHLTKNSASTYEAFDKYRNENVTNQVDIYLQILNTIYANPVKLLMELKQSVLDGNPILTMADFERFEMIKAEVDYLDNVIKFLQLIDTAMSKMMELLETTSISDMNEAADFFISAYQFEIDNVQDGVMAMLSIMKRSEQERKDVVLKAFKVMYLETDTSNMFEHSKTVVDRLIKFLKNIPIASMNEYEMIISEWIAKGILDNNIIDMLWQYFTKKIPVSNDDCHASAELLRMAAIGRKTIIMKNLMLVATIGFGDLGRENLAFLGSACELLAVAGRNKIDITSSDCPLRISIEDDMFKNLHDILSVNFLKPVEFYYKALSGAIDLVYRLCDKPNEFCEELIKNFFNQLKIEENEILIERFVLMRIFQTIGLIAVKHLDYLDETVYKELKRRDYIRNLRKSKQNGKSKRQHKNAIDLNEISSASSRRSINNSMMNSINGDESTLEGAVAADEDADIILKILERDTVTGSGGLGKLSYLMQTVCQRPDIYNDEMLQGAAVTALIRYMLVSTEFCNRNIQLLFTILEKTEYEEIKVSILTHLHDLLSRFPNVIEPWLSKIYQELKHDSNQIRKATFFTLSSLILNDMIRAQTNVTLMVNCLEDDDAELRIMCRSFFTTLAHKENVLYNILPDISTHLIESKVITEEMAKNTMKFLFGLINKNKYIENLVDRFCSKFLVTDNNIVHARHIAFCLSLITYNEKALRKLQANLYLYKNVLHDLEIYTSFKSILQNCSKQQVGKIDLKPIVEELEKNIESVFELNEDGQLMKPPPVKPPLAKKTRRKRKARKNNNNDSDSENEE